MGTKIAAEDSAWPIRLGRGEPPLTMLNPFPAARVIATMPDATALNAELRRG